MIPPCVLSLEPREAVGKWFPWVPCSLKGVTSVDGGGSEDHIWGLRDIQNTSVPMDIEVEREKSYYFAFIILSFLLS